MPRWKDIAGERYGRLVAVEFVGVTERTNKAIWKFRCDCGNEIEIRASRAKDGHYVSCGCYRKEMNATHNLSNTRIYSIWCDMKKRCNNPNQKHFDDYGGRGIKVCEDWNEDFILFYQWSIENGYTDELTIDRIDVNGNYEPSNCRWISFSDQQWNRRNTIYIEINGEKKTIKQVCEEYGLLYNYVYDKYRRGLEII